MAFSPDGKKLAVTGGTPGQQGEVQVWDVEAKKLLLSHPVTFDTVYGCNWSNDGTLISFGGRTALCRVIEAATGKQVLFQNTHEDRVLQTVFSSDDSHVISVSGDRTAADREGDAAVYRQHHLHHSGALKGELTRWRGIPRRT
ncbi:MAG: hypothetical protein U0903_01415 [Planctomycetales bacterium]